MIRNIFKRRNKRIYGHIISLGCNCEVSFQFFLKYNFVESSLFAWSYVGECCKLMFALKNMDVLSTKGFKKEFPMYIDNATGIAFHSKNSKDSTEQELLDELNGRIVYLRDKFRKTATDGKKNLYIYKYPSKDFSSEKAVNDIKELYAILTELVENDFNLLIISEKQNKIAIESMENVFIRYVKFYTPDNKVTSKPYDKKHYNKIFSEFKPGFKLEKKKRFKFEDTGDE